MNLLFVISGSISAYKSIDVIRELGKKHEVKVILTKGGEQFLTPSSVRALCGETFSDEWVDLTHVQLSKWAERIVVIPASMNFLSEVRSGSSRRLSTATILAHNKPVLFFPAANPRMYSNPTSKEVLRGLRKVGHEICEPWSGPAACGDEGRGRLPPKNVCVLEIERFIGEKSLASERTLVLTGRGKVFIDPIRCITNESSGTTGLMVALALWKAGSSVRIAGNFPQTDLPSSIEVREAWELSEFKEEVLRAEREDFGLFVFAAALPNFAVKERSAEKLKEPKTLTLTRTEDLISGLCKRKKERTLVVGFCAETSDVLKRCKEKMVGKGADLMIATDATKTMGKRLSTGFIVRKDGSFDEFKNLPKEELAELIKEEIISLRRSGK
jgi:phosphopantothenoylcysteine decarboxylase/phosphopantothenate--cysteine ligase